jgi:hypothetical protein
LETPRNDMETKVTIFAHVIIIYFAHLKQWPKSDELGEKSEWKWQKKLTKLDKKIDENLEAWYDHMITPKYYWWDLKLI